MCRSTSTTKVRHHAVAVADGAVVPGRLALDPARVPLPAGVIAAEICSASVCHDPFHASSGQLVEPGSGDLDFIGLHPGDQDGGSRAGQQVFQLGAALAHGRTGEVVVLDA